MRISLSDARSPSRPSPVCARGHRRSPRARRNCSRRAAAARHRRRHEHRGFSRQEGWDARGSDRRSRHADGAALHVSRLLPRRVDEPRRLDGLLQPRRPRRLRPSLRLLQLRGHSYQALAHVEGAFDRRFTREAPAPLPERPLPQAPLQGLVARRAPVAFRIWRGVSWPSRAPPRRACRPARRPVPGRRRLTPLSVSLQTTTRVTIRPESAPSASTSCVSAL